MFEGLKIPDFDILSEIDSTHNKSTMVYLGRYKKTDITVCKVVSKKYTSQAKKNEHFKNELVALQYFTNKSSPNINNLVKHFEDENNHYIILRAEEGLPLHKLMQMAGKFHQNFVPVVISQVVWILQELHENGFIYRDVKASNFILNNNGKLTLVDLGLAKKIDKKRTFSICGTLHAMPPEVLLSQPKEGYSFEFDYYGLGILIYELTVGQPPYGYHTSNQNFYKDVESGLKQEHLDKITDLVTRDLVQKLLASQYQRLGCKAGIKQILQHPYFRSLNLEDIQQIYESNGEKALIKYPFGEHRQEIEDFGIQKSRYAEICPDDPFYKFG